MRRSLRSFSRFSAVSTAASSRLLVTLICLFAFFFQAYVAQTHIHVAGASDGVTVSASQLNPVSKDSGAPDQSSQDDLSKCPFCQTVVSAGAFMAPSLIFVIQPIQTGVVFVLAELQLPVSLRPGHVWKSRGPPQG